MSKLALLSMLSISALVGAVSPAPAARATETPSSRAIPSDLTLELTPSATRWCTCANGHVMTGVSCRTAQCTNLCVHSGQGLPLC